MRTDTYIAGDFDNDKNAIDHIYQLKRSGAINFKDAHDETQAKDDSLYCSIKSSLKKRLDLSNKLVLIVGNNTTSVTKGNCMYCGSYNSYSKYCARGYSVDFRSFIQFECEIAKEAYLNNQMSIYVLYNSLYVEKEKCIDCLRYTGEHLPIVERIDNKYYWNDNNIKKAFY